MTMIPIADIFRRSPFSEVQTRRRLTSLANAGLIKRKREPTHQKWLYEEEAIVMLKRLAKLEKSLRPYQAIAKLASEDGTLPYSDMEITALRTEIGKRDETIVDQYREIERLKEEVSLAHQEISHLQAAIQRLKEHRYPVEVDTFSQRVRLAWQILRQQKENRP